MIKPIETVYKGYRFRSRSEARWAIFFDALGIDWIYEPEGFELSDGTMYLPDFYLPQCRTFFEVKGIMQDEDKHKIDLLSADSKMPVAVGYADMTFQSPDNWYGESFEPSAKCDSMFVRCNECGKLYFVGNIGSYECLCCGCYDGDRTFTILGWGDGFKKYSWNTDEFNSAVEKARQARFEHGETPA